MTRPRIEDVRWSEFTFHQVIELPAAYEVYDFTTGYDPERMRNSEYGIGRYNEKRAGMYEQELFSGTRNVHMGIDIAAPVGTPVRSFYEGQVTCFGYNAAEGDYGYTLVTEHTLGQVVLYSLWGHLSAKSIVDKEPGQLVTRGEVVGWLGDRHENGGWNPHLHLQLCWERPEKPDLPGVVSEADREAAVALYPDPRLVLGRLY